jgi:Uma2 family endonuclease
MTWSAKQLAEQMPDARQLLSDEPEMESTRHWQQLSLLVDCLEWRWQQRSDFFIGANLSVYYDHQELRQRGGRGPDFFLVRKVTREPRNSWVVWEEGGRYPDLIIELLSDSTAKADRTTKKQLYQTVFRTPEYFWFSPITLELAGFRLMAGVYKPIKANPQGRLWSKMLGLCLGVHDGWLRYFERSGDLVSSSAEAAHQATDAAVQAQHRADKLAARLRELGIDPDSIE